MGKYDKWEPEEIIFLGIIMAIICFALGAFLLIIGVFNSLLSCWVSSSYWYVKALALFCYIGEICFIAGIVIGIKAKFYNWCYEIQTKKELMKIREEMRKDGRI